MAVKIRLKRMGKIRAPHYRVVVVDARKKRDGRVIEEIGKYHPKEEPSLIEVTSDRARYWLGVGAQPTEAVAALLKVTGDWQQFKGLEGGEGTLRHAEGRRDKLAAFNEALKDSSRDSDAAAVTARSPKASKKAASGDASAATTSQAGADAAPETSEPAAGETPEAAAASGDTQGEAQPADADAAEQAETAEPKPGA